MSTVFVPGPSLLERKSGLPQGPEPPGGGGAWLLWGGARAGMRPLDTHTHTHTPTTDFRQEGGDFSLLVLVGKDGGPPNAGHRSGFPCTLTDRTQHWGGPASPSPALTLEESLNLSEPLSPQLTAGVTTVTEGL